MKKTSEEYYSEWLNTQECEIHVRAKRAIRKGQLMIKVDARQLESILQDLDRLRIEKEKQVK